MKGSGIEEIKVNVTVFMNRYSVELEEYSMYSVYSTSKSSWNSGERFQRFWTFISVRSELEQVEFKILIPVIPLPEKSQKNNAV